MGVPDFLTVEEAARILRIGRTAAYLAAKRFRETDGAEGLPVVAIRGSLRVPRRKLEQFAGGPVGLASPPIDAAASSPQSTSMRRTRRDVDQARLPFSV